MLLTVDVGNTITHCGLFDGRKLLKHKCLETRHVSRRATRAVDQTLHTGWRYEEAVVCSVVSGFIPKTGAPTLVVNHKLDLGLNVRYKYPSKVGADRLANAVALKFIYGYPALAVDFGTAITIDVVSKNGDYCGGVILPGIEMIRHGLSERTSLLPLVSMKKPPEILGRTTVDAIRSGMYYGTRGMIKELIAGLKKELRFPKKTVIISTGGDSDILGEGVGKIDKFLTLRGMEIIYERNRTNRSAFICKQ